MGRVNTHENEKPSSKVPQVINYFFYNPGQLGLLMQEKKMDASAVKRGLEKLSVSSFSA